MTGNDKTEETVRLSAAHHTVDSIRVVTLRGEIDHTTRDVVENALLGQDDTTRPPGVVADLEGVSFMDSSGLNVFISAHRQISEAGGWLRIAAAQEAVQRVLCLVGVDTVIDCHPTLTQALDS
ncbi:MULTISPECIES: STAS domain-containing protein [unclassified Streptomyces]|uniref:STAS domain-containing protein n=1 Tax=unclassified Streptomyces TaxID=2593676 RepID=UPI00339F81C9